MVRFTLFGIQVEIQPWFWITLAFLGGVTTAKTPESFLGVLLFILAGCISILVHEFGHALTGRHFGAQTAITLHAFGGFASFPAGRFTRVQDFLVTAAGPAIQLLLGGIFAVILGFTIGKIPPMLELFVKHMIWVSIVWAILNLIPVLPMDGGRLMASILGPGKHQLTLQISMGIAITAALVLYQLTHSFLFPLFLGLMAYQNWQQLQSYRR